MLGWIPAVWRYREFVKNLVKKDFKVRYQGSALGFLWTLVTPLVTITIFLVAFKYILGVAQPNFALFLVTGILPWTFSATAVSMSTESIIGGAQLIKKASFPRETLPLATVLFNFAHLLLALLAFFPVILFLGGRLTPAFFALPVLILLHFGLTLGAAFLLSSLTVFYQDLRPITELGLTALFWMTPIVYDLALVPDRLRPLWAGLPMAGIIRGYQDIIYRGVMPSPAAWLTSLAWAFGMLLIGGLVFRAWRSRFAEEL